MSHGVPCLAFRSDGVHSNNVNDELIDHDRTGLLASGESDFLCRLQSVLRCPQVLIRLGEAARREIRSRYGWDAHLARYEHLFATLQTEARCGRS